MGLEVVVRAWEEERKKRGEFVLSSDLVPLRPRLGETQAGMEIIILAFYALSAPNGVGQSRILTGTGQTRLGSR